MILHVDFRRHDIDHGNKDQEQKAKLQGSSANISLKLVSWENSYCMLICNTLAYLNLLVNLKEK